MTFSLENFNAQAKDALSALRLPHKKDEAWRYLNLKSLTEAAFEPVSASDADVSSLVDIDNLNCQKLTFVNGQFSQDLSVLSDDTGVEVTLFSQANDSQKAIIAENLSKQAPADNYFTQLNASQMSEGVLVYVSKNTQSQLPVLLNYISAESEGSLANQRLLVVVEQSANATVIEHFNSVDEQHQSMLNGVSEFIIGDNAKLNHYRLMLAHESTQNISGFYADLARDAQLNTFMIALGSVLNRSENIVNHSVGGSHCEIKGVYLPKNKQQVDFHSIIEHKVPNCTTSEVFRGILADESNAVFNGRIHIHPQAQKTLAELSNKNLLLSNKAQINTKPELEIYADDVKCAHGATVAQIDDKALFYMQSRGISRQEAQVMLSFGFINELLNDLELEAITHLLRPMLAKIFTKDESLMAHLES